MEWLQETKLWVEKGTPATLLLMLVLGGATLYYQHEEVLRLHASQRELFELVMAEKDKVMELVLKLGDCEKR